MKCQNCGAELPEQVKFCPMCGSQTAVAAVEPAMDDLDKTVFVRGAEGPVSEAVPNQNEPFSPSTQEPADNPSPKKQKGQKSKAKKAKVILICVLSGILALAIALAAVFFTSSAYSIYKDMNDQNFEGALQVYRDEAKDSFVQETILDLLLKNRASQVETKYQNGEVDYTLAAEELEALDEMGFEGAKDKRTEILRTRAEEIVAQFESGDLDYASAEAELTQLRRMGLADAKESRTQVMASYGDRTVSQFETGELSFQEAKDILEGLKEDGYNQAASLIEDITASNNASNAVSKADEYYEDGQYEKAISEYSKVPESDKNYQAVQEKLNQVYADYIQSVVKKAKDHIAAKNYKQAVQAVDTAYGILPEGMDTASLDTVREESLTAYKTDVANRVTELTEAEKWSDAFALIDEAIAFEGSDYFRDLQATTENAYVASVTATVEKHLGNEDYISAKRVVENALTILPGNEGLKELKKQVEEATPTYLLDVCSPYESNGYTKYVNGETISMGGKTYTNGFTLGGDHYSDEYAIFNVDSQHTLLNFLIGHIDNTDMNNATVKIYCDGVLAQEITIKSDALPQKISVDITGVNQLKIVVSDVNRYTQYGFANVTVK